MSRRRTTGFSLRAVMFTTFGILPTTPPCHRRSAVTGWKTRRKSRTLLFITTAYSVLNTSSVVSSTQPDCLPAFGGAAPYRLIVGRPDVNSPRPLPTWRRVLLAAFPQEHAG